MRASPQKDTLLLKNLMEMNNNISIFGASGHAGVVADLAMTLGYRISGIYDHDDTKKKLLQFNVTHCFSSVPKSTIVAIGDNFLREKIVNKFSVRPPSLVHPFSFVSCFSSIGEGTIVMSGVSISTNARIGKHCILNTNCSVDHDCRIHDFVHVSPNASIAGNVEIGKRSHVGTGASIIQGISIGKNVTIGAGAVIINNIPDDVVVVGVPGRILKKNIWKI